MRSAAGGSELARHWALDPTVDYLNHGSFGACPRAVLERQQELRDRLEAEPVRFYLREWEGLLDAARERLAAFIGAEPADVVPVTNATEGVSTVLRSLDLAAGDELLTTDHAYGACRNALDVLAGRAGARVAVARVPFPLPSSDVAVEVVLAALSPRTRLLMIDHVTSPTGLVLPIERLVREVQARGVDVLVDAAHAPGMVPMRVHDLGAAYTTGNCHKWICAPKGAAFLHVRRDRQAGIRPLSISHGSGVGRRGRSRLHDEFDWAGTGDPTPILCVPAALDAVASLVPGGWDEVRRRNRALALRGREILTGRLGILAPCPEEMVGSMAALPLPDGSPHPPRWALETDPLQDRLLDDWRIEVPIQPWPSSPHRLLRISAQLYNREAQYARLAEALRDVLTR
jgi:isopenicillin-N epimerase